MSSATTHLGITRAPAMWGLAPHSTVTRDREIVRWVARMGAVTLAQVRARFELGLGGMLSGGRRSRMRLGGSSLARWGVA